MNLVSGSAAMKDCRPPSCLVERSQNAIRTRQHHRKVSFSNLDDRDLSSTSLLSKTAPKLSAYWKWQGVQATVIRYFPRSGGERIFHLVGSVCFSCTLIRSVAILFQISPPSSILQVFRRNETLHVFIALFCISPMLHHANIMELCKETPMQPSTKAA